MKRTIETIFKESIDVKRRTLEANITTITAAATAMKKALRQKRRVFLFGNGGSAADSQHIAAELIGRFKKERRALAAMALTTDTSVLTAVGNDYGFEFVFSRQLEGLARAGDVVIGLSTSGQSKNVLEAIRVAKKLKCVTISLTGRDGGLLSKLSDININVPAKDTARIQEAHICIGHILCELIEA